MRLVGFLFSREIGLAIRSDFVYNRYAPGRSGTGAILQQDGPFFMTLLIVIYISFIALGIPDSLIGSAWPAIYPEFGVSVSSVSAVTLLISGCTILSSVFSARVLRRFGTARVAAVSTGMTALALLGFRVSPSLLCMCLLAIPFGLGAGAIDAGLNNYVAIHYSAKHMNLMHCFYGVGVSVSPYLMSLALAGSSWRNGYRYAFFIQAAITLMLFLSFPLWKRGNGGSGEAAESGRTLSFAELVRIKPLRTAWCAHVATNAIEYACGTWGSTYLVLVKDFSSEDGAFALTLYYAGMALGRFLSGILSERIKTWRRIGIGCGILACAILGLLLPLPPQAAVASLFLAGLGNGSIYPNLIHLTPYSFGRDVSQSVMGSQIAAAYIGVMLAPPTMGLISGIAGFSVFPLFLSALYAGLVLSLAVLIRRLKKQNRFDRNA